MRNWDKKLGAGRDKIFEVRRIHNDLTFIDEFLTLDFCRRHKLFSFGYNEDSGYYEIESRQFAEVKQRLLFNLTNMGRPIIYLKDANYKNRGELFLEHRFSGVELQANYAQDTLSNLYKLWKRPVHIETTLEDSPVVISFDGIEHSQSESS
jgi:stage V sporulation protein R